MTATAVIKGGLVDLNDRLATASAQDILRYALTDMYPPGRVALVSSFGTESAVLLHMVAQIDPATPVLFIETGKLFGETLRYRDALVARLGLTDVRVLTPDGKIVEEDSDGLLFTRDADRCCFLRKVVPLQQALTGFSGWINGRKGHHGGARAALPVIEADGPRLKVTPLARWSAQDVTDYFTAHDLPHHPLEEEGYASVGCYTCTARVQAGDDVRAGRWAGKDKAECGIHMPVTEFEESWWPAG